MIQEIELSRILPNPFQTRKTEDGDHIQNLAHSIHENGLLQIPTARIAPGQQGKEAMKNLLVQLAFGHSRLAAYKWLVGSGIFDNPQDFQSMPLNITELDDQQMFEQAVAENRERKDLSPIEEAQAMIVYRDHFKKKSSEIGQLFHLSDSAVRNKIRLLDLPDEVKPAFATGQLTEGAGRELLTFQELPEEIKNDHKEFIAHALEVSASAELIRENISRIVQNKGQRLDKKRWKHTDELQGEDIVGICKGCSFLLKRDDAEHCLKPKCYAAKEKAFRKLFLEQASLLSGIPVLDESESRGYYGETTDFSYGSEVKLESIRKARCENLRLKYDTYAECKSNGSKSLSHLEKEGFPEAEIVCCKKNGFCTCMNAMKAGVTIEASADGAAMAKEDLKEINRQVRAQKKYNAEVVKGLINKGAAKIFDGLNSDNFQIWAGIYNHFGYSEEQRDNLKLIREEKATINDIKYFIAKVLAKQGVWSEEPKAVLAQVDENLKKLGLEDLGISFGGDNGEEPADVTVAQGKTLLEVFTEEVPAEDQDMEPRMPAKTVVELNTVSMGTEN